MTEALFSPGAPPRRILVCQLRQIGDVLLATPSLELLARRFPGAEIHVLTEKKCVPMLEGNPHVHTLWPLDKKALPTLLRELVWYGKIASTGFDLVVDFQQLPRCRWVVALSRAKVRLSFPPPWYLRPLYTHWEKPLPAYASAYKAGILAPLGIAWRGERPRLYLSAREKDAASALLRDLGLEGLPFVTVDPTHRHATRRWPARHFAALMDMAAEAEPSLRFLLLYGPGEEEDVRALRELCRHKDRALVPPALLSLRQAAACMERAALHLGNCSAPRHMAVAVGVPTLTVLGSTGKGWTFPSPEHRHIRAGDFFPLPCQACNKNHCDRDLHCLEGLGPELAAPVFLEHLRKFGARRCPDASGGPADLPAAPPRGM